MESNAGIKRLMAEGKLVIERPEHLGPVKVGTASVDLHLDEVYVLPKDNTGRYMHQPFEPSIRDAALIGNFRGLETAERSANGWVLEPRKTYVALPAERITTEVPYNITTRSTDARAGICIDDPVGERVDDWCRYYAQPTRTGSGPETRPHVLIATTRGTHSHLPRQHAPVQATFGSPRYLEDGEILTAMKDGLAHASQETHLL